ncbi:MAG TPA: trypsin-like peptidase domain-containing protein, partial [Gemmataceae bacterium]|nr:trypsin-like peptidase domain-containing protein [Gemmataceae bacterium]
MAIQAPCPQCGVVYKLGDDYLGKKIVCKRCRTAFVIRGGQAAGSTSIVPESVKPSPPPRSPIRPGSGENRGVPAASALPAKGRRRYADRENEVERRSNPLIWILAGLGIAGVLLLAAIVIGVVLFTRSQAPSLGQVAANNSKGVSPPAALTEQGRKIAPLAIEHVEEANPEKPADASPANNPPAPKAEAKSPKPAETPSAQAAPRQALEGVGGGRLSLEMLQHLKRSTVFIKREAGRLSATGSGFVMKVDGETAYIITNHHVVDPSGEMLRLGPGGRIQTVKVRASSAVVLAIFRSGTKEERALNAEVIASDPSGDLAVLKVNGVRDYAQAIDLDQKAQLVETMPVFILGFPFGKMLSMNKGNPSVTINKGTVSSLRENDRGQMKAVQIDGALNPGNSGGPVVDDHGRLVGVAVATIEGSGIGLAIAPEELTLLLLGRVGGVSLTKRPVADQKVTLDLEAQLIDPMNKIRMVALHWARKGINRARPQPDGAGLFPPLSDAQDVDLKIDGQRAVGTLHLPLKESEAYDIEYQVAYINGTGKVIYTAAATYHVDDQVARPPVFAGRQPNLRPGVIQASPVPVIENKTASNKPLWPKAGTVGDIDVKEVPLEVETILPCICWDKTPETFCVLNSSGMLSRVRLDNFEVTETQDIGRPCSWLTMSSTGPIVTVNSAQEAWLLDPSLSPIKKLAMAGVTQVVSSPASSIAIAVNRDGFAGGLGVIDLSKRAFVAQHSFNELGLIGGVTWPTMSPDGKYMFVQGGLEELKRIR